MKARVCVRSGVQALACVRVSVCVCPLAISGYSERPCAFTAHTEVHIQVSGDNV